MQGNLITRATNPNGGQWNLNFSAQTFSYTIQIVPSRMTYQIIENKGEIAIDKTNFPDDHFRNYLLSQSYGADGKLSEAEIADIKVMFASYKMIEDLRGIEFFTELTSLYCEFNELTSLDLSKNTKLESVLCYQNRIKGTAMDELINSLPTSSERRFLIAFSPSDTEGNVCTKEQVAAARSKGWSVYDWGWVDYEGLETDNYFTAQTEEGVSMAFAVADEAEKTCIVARKNEDESAISRSTSGTVTIPAAANGYTVVGIGEQAFKYCPLVTSFAIPSTVQSIGHAAFHLTNATDWCGYNYEHSGNFWKKYVENSSSMFTISQWACDASWYEVDNPEYTYADRIFTIYATAASNERWQNQFRIKPISLRLRADKHYDFSCIIRVTKDHPSVTMSIQKPFASDGIYWYSSLKANTDYIVQFEDFDGATFADSDLEFIFDFGGNQANTVVTIERITLKEHNKNDGTANVGKGGFLSVLTNVVSYIKEPFDIEAFDNTLGVATLYVPYGTKGKYQSVSGWDGFANITEREKKTTVIQTSPDGYATFYDSKSAYELPKGLAASVVSGVNNGKLIYKQIANGSQFGGVIPKGVAVMLTADIKAAAFYALESSESTATYTNTNLLHGNDNATTTNGGGDCYYYKLTYGAPGSVLSNIFGWYWGAANGSAFQIEGHKAWLAVPKSQAAKANSFSVDGDITGITDVTENDAEDDIYHDLQGRKVTKPSAKGVYIYKGKKISVK